MSLWCMEKHRQMWTVWPCKGKTVHRLAKMKLIFEKKKIYLMMKIFYSPSEWTQEVVKVYYGVREGKGIAMVVGTPVWDREQWTWRGWAEGKHHVWIWRVTTEKKTKKLRKEKSKDGDITLRKRGDVKEQVNIIWAFLREEVNLWVFFHLFLC